MAQAAPLRKPLQLKKMKDRSLVLSINEITHYFKKWTAESGNLKKIYFLYKSVMLQIDPLKSRYSQKKQYSERTLRLKVLRNSSSFEKVAFPKVTLASAIVCNCSSKIFILLYE